MGRRGIEAAMSMPADPSEKVGRPGGGASPRRTYALVVGVERYDAGLDWDLDGPANDAARFTSWLVDRGVPPDQVLVFLSPLGEQPLEMPLPPGVTVSPARREPVIDAITRTLPQWRGDLLWLFWAGHGVVTREDHLRLFYADASAGDKRNLDVHSLLTALRSDLYAGLPRQIGIVDACQTYAERLQLAATLPAETLPYGRPLPNREQFALYAASPGQVAVNLGSVKAGLFSQQVMEELPGPGGNEWPPEMNLIAARLDQRFSELRAAGRTDQTPTSFRWRPWKGGERVLGETTTGLARALDAASRRPPSGLALREVVNSLLDLDVVADPVRRASVIRQLRKGLATTISYDPSSRPHLVNIITRSLDYPGGLAELMEAVKLYADPADPALLRAQEAARLLAEETGQNWIG
jgi:Effector-associated domain 2/Caspase domain